jgi:hypothetical protein
MDVQNNINDKKLHDMKKLPVLLQNLQNTERTPLTYQEFVNMTTRIMEGRNQDVLLCEQQLQNHESEIYHTGHRKLTNHKGKDKLLGTEVFYLSFILEHLFQKYNIFKGEDENLKFQVIYLGASSGVTESTHAGQILHHVEKLMIMFPPKLIDKWWFVDPRPMTISDKHSNYKHLQCLFSDKEIQDFNQAQRDDRSIRYIVISDIRTPINYDMTSAPREIAKDVLGAYFLCENEESEKKQALFNLLTVVMQDALEKTLLVEQVIDHDQKYQDNVRNSLNLDAMSTKFRAPYFYPRSTQEKYDMLDIPRLLQPNGPLNSTELRELFIIKEPVHVKAQVAYPRKTDRESALSKVYEESETENREWNSTSNPTTRKGESVDLRMFDNKIAAYNHHKEKNDEKLQLYTKSLYEICYEKCTGERPSEDQLQCLNITDHWRQHDTSSTFDQQNDNLFWEWINDNDPKKHLFFQSPSCEFMKDFVQHDLHSKGSQFPRGNESVLAEMSLLVSGILAKPEDHTLHELMQQYEKAVNLRQTNQKNYNNFGSNSNCPLFIERLDILMYIRVLLLMKHNPSIVTTWFEKYMTPEKTENKKYTILLQRLLSVYNTKNNDNSSIKENFSFMTESTKFTKVTTEALKRCNTANDLQYMLGYIRADSKLPLSPNFLNTRHWAIVFYNSCVQKIVEKELNFVYPALSDTDRSQNEKILTDLRIFFKSYLQQGEDKCLHLGKNPKWNTARWPSGFPILHLASAKGCTALVYLILTEYLPETLRPELINFRRRRIGYTALHLAVYHRKSDIEKLLMEYGARDDIVCKENGVEETVKQLQQYRSTRIYDIVEQKAKKTTGTIHDNEPDNPDWHIKQPSQPKKEEFPIAKGPQEAEKTSIPIAKGPQEEKKTSTVKRETKKPKDTTKYKKREETDKDGWTEMKKKANVSDLIEKLISFIE